MEKSELLGQLVQKAYECKKHHIFIDYSPHVESLSIRIYLNGWNERDPDETHRIYLNKRDSAKKLKAMIEYIEYLGGKK